MVLISKYLLVPLLKIFIKKETGFKKIPDKGPVLLVANHSSYIDAVLLMCLTAWYKNRYSYFIVAREVYERNWFMKFLLGFLFRQIPTKGAVKKAITKLEQGEIVGLFPEASRTHTGEIQKAKKTGLGVLALLTDTVVVPIGIKGSFEFWSRFRTFPTFKRCIEIRVGKLMKFKGKATKKKCLQIQTKIMKEVAKLAGKKYK